MAANQPLWPREWLMTDERIGDRLWQAIDRVPESGGVVFRHYSLVGADRAALAWRVAKRCREQGLILAVARDAALAEEVGATMAHNPVAATSLPVSMSVHDEAEALAARNAGASLVFVSPVFPTPSHPGGASLGVEEAMRLAGVAGCPAIALGGMSRARLAELGGRAFHGWAGIDAWSEG